MSNLNITSLPNEIIEEIFDYLSFSDLENVTLVSKQFNEIVGQSKTLMNKMDLMFTDENEGDYDHLINSKRKYQAVWIYENDYKMNEILKNFFQKQSLTEFKMSFAEMKASDFQFIMECLSKTVVRIEIGSAALEYDSQITAIEFPKLECLILPHVINHYKVENSLLINFFYKAKNVKVLDWSENYRMKSDQIRCLEIIGSMNLTELTLFNNTIQILDASDEFTKQLKLETFCKNDFSQLTHGEALENLIRFLNTQRSTLKYLQLDKIDFTAKFQQCLLSLTKLQVLTLKYPRFNELSTDQNDIVYNENYSIQKIALHPHYDNKNQNIFADFLKKCKGLKKMHFKRYGITFEMLYTLAYHTENLEYLSLEHSPFYPMTMPKIKEMKLSSDKDIEQIVHMILLNRQLRKVILPTVLQNNQECIRAVEETNVAVEFHEEQVIYY